MSNISKLIGASLMGAGLALAPLGVTAQELETDPLETEIQTEDSFSTTEDPLDGDTTLDNEIVEPINEFEQTEENLDPTNEEIADPLQEDQLDGGLDTITIQETRQAAADAQQEIQNTAIEAEQEIQTAVEQAEERLALRAAEVEDRSNWGWLGLLGLLGLFGLAGRGGKKRYVETTEYTTTPGINTTTTPGVNTTPPTTPNTPPNNRL